MLLKYAKTHIHEKYRTDTPLLSSKITKIYHLKLQRSIISNKLEKVHIWRILFLSISSKWRCDVPWKDIWKPKLPIRVAFFLWTAAWGRIFTINNLRKRNIIVVEWCCMCKRSGKIVDHYILKKRSGKTADHLLIYIYIKNS